MIGKPYLHRLNKFGLGLEVPLYIQINKLGLPRTNFTRLRTPRHCRLTEAFGLGEDADQLAALVDGADYVWLVAAFVRTSISGDGARIRARH